MKFWEKLENLLGKKTTTGPLYFHNTLTNSKEEFTLPQNVRKVRMYNCGPTVYGLQHIGNLSYAVFVNILRRTLDYNGFTVKQVMNFTDVGHLTSDSDEGDDKMVKGLKRDGLEPTLENMKLLGEKYAAQFLSDVSKLNIDTSQITFPRASDHIAGQIAMVQTLEEKGYAYKTKKGVYFDTSRFPEYGALGGIDLAGLKEGARIAADPEKRNPTDFNLWKLSKKLGWPSPWGKGYPGWHIECSAMINATLGKQIDIHTGGIEHIPVHHNNEIAQSEAATGKKPMSRFWLHRAHLQIEGSKIAKSEGNTIYLSDIESRGFHPLSFRYLLLTSHYSTPASFSWDALSAAQTSFLKLRRFVETAEDGGTILSSYQKKIRERLNDNLDTSGALGIVWEMQKDHTESGADIKATILDADRVLGLGLGNSDTKLTELSDKHFGKSVSSNELPKEVQELIEKREMARKEKNWAIADEARAELEKRGFSIEDTPNGPQASIRG